MVTNAVGKKAGQGYRECWGGERGLVFLGRELRKGLTVKMVFE